MKNIVAIITLALTFSTLAYAQPLTLVCRTEGDRTYEKEWKIDVAKKIVVKDGRTYDATTGVRAEFKPYTVCISNECISRIDGLYILADKPYGRCYKVNNLMF